MSELSSSQLIYRVVPQRYPFLMIDKIVEHEFRKIAVCQKNVTAGEEVLTGHFPDNPIYPGVLMIEMGLQTTQVMLTDLKAVQGTTNNTSKADQGFLLSVEKFKFQKIVRPGDIIRITSELVQEAMGMMKAKITLTNDRGETVAAGQVVVGVGGSAS